MNTHGFLTALRPGRILTAAALISGCCLSPGCSETPEDSAARAPASPTTTTTAAATPSAPGAPAPSATPSGDTAAAEPVPEFRPLILSGLGPAQPKAGSNASQMTASQKIQSVISRLQPIQILLGKWRGTTRREYESFKAVDSHEWVWDLRTNPEQPALVMASDKSPYLRNSRLSWDIAAEKFILTGLDAEGRERRFSGDFTEAPHEITGSDDKQHRVFRLELSENDSAEGEQWQLAIAQQENNRYLLEVGKRRGKADFSRFDTVSTQREGTSFALSDTGYAERTCIISEGLGTTEVSWKGRSYWVCCSGCKAAFEEDPDTWIARAAERAKEQK
ncbi:MAG: hypothetical protein ACKO3T_26240 [Planctomycetaceae bacterium]